LGWPAPGGYAGVKESHMHANVFGFVGLVAAAVLLELIPARVGRPLRFPRLVPWTSSLLTIGGVGLSAGPWLALMPLTVLGLVTYIVGSATLLANLVGTVLGYRAWTPNLAHVLAAYVWMFVPFVVAPTVLITTGELPSGAVEAAAVTSFIGGWLLQIVIGAFLARAPAGAAGTPNGEGSWFAVTVLNLGVAVTWAGAFVPTAVWAPVTALGYGLVVIGWLPPLGAVLHWLSSIER
ncbi:MAG: hypothetical protein HY329_11375, partial [Chloroflexi bacterium]|nr:hypothetical protein [Chloroflexota bacterium]